MTSTIFCAPPGSLRRVRRLIVSTLRKSSENVRPTFTIDELLVNRLLSEGIERINKGDHVWVVVPTILYKCPPRRWADLSSNLLEFVDTKKYFSN